jgi:hypothetical protein
MKTQAEKTILLMVSAKILPDQGLPDVLQKSN